MKAKDRIAMLMLNFLEELGKQTKGKELPLTEDQALCILNSLQRVWLRKMFDSGMEIDTFVRMEKDKILKEVRDE